MEDSHVNWIHTPSKAVARCIRISLRQPECLAARCLGQSRSFAVPSSIIISYRRLSEPHYPNPKRILDPGRIFPQFVLTSLLL